MSSLLVKTNYLIFNALSELINKVTEEELLDIIYENQEYKIATEIDEMILAYAKKNKYRIYKVIKTYH